MKAALKFLIRVYTMKKDRIHSYMRDSKDEGITRQYQCKIDCYNEILDDVKDILNEAS